MSWRRSQNSFCLLSWRVSCFCFGLSFLGPPLLVRLDSRLGLLPINGVNVTVGGKLTALEEHIAAVKSNYLFEGTEFKLASCHHPLNDKVSQACGFTSLSIRVVEELVTLSPLLKSPDISNAGKHLSAAEFHSVLQSENISKFYCLLLCYAAKTWHGGFVGMMIFGASEVSRNVDLGDETTTMLCKFVVRAS